MKITINPLDEKSISEALGAVKQYKEEFEQKEQEFIRRLAEIGVSVASAGFSAAAYDGENDVTVTSTQDGSSAYVKAYGTTVGFIEFGTGVKFQEWDSSTTDYTPPEHGTYGKGQGKNPGGWWFGSGRHTYGNPPAEAMLTARDEMVEQVAQIAREVWK